MGQKQSRTENYQNIQDYLWQTDAVNATALSKNTQELEGAILTKSRFSHKQKYGEIVKECFMNAEEGITRRIYSRVAAKSNEFFSFMGKMPNETRTKFIERLRIYLIDMINSIDNVDEIHRLSIGFGAYHVHLRRYGFKADFFALIADNIASECVLLGGNATALASATFFRAWMTVIGQQFSTVRDGFNAELRQHQKHTPPNVLGLDSLPNRSTSKKRHQYRHGTANTQSSDSNNDDGSDQLASDECSSQESLVDASAKKRNRSPYGLTRVHSMPSMMANRCKDNNNAVEAWRMINTSTVTRPPIQLSKGNPSAQMRTKSPARKNAVAAPKGLDLSQKRGGYKMLLPHFIKRQSRKSDESEDDERQSPMKKEVEGARLRSKSTKRYRSQSRTRFNRRKSISTTDLFNPDQILTDFMKKRDALNK